MTTKKEILECLMNMCEQYLAYPDGSLHHSCISTGENALNLLVHEGLAKSEGGDKYQLLWDNLDNFNE